MSETPETTAETSIDTRETWGSAFVIPCPASIWLLGAAANCTKGTGHEGNHQIKIEWSIG